MKKLFLFLAIMAFAVATFAGTPQRRLVTIVTDTSEHFHQFMYSGDPVLILSTSQWYILNQGIAVVDQYNMNYMITNGYATVTYQTGGFSGATFTVTGNGTIGGNLAVTGSITGASLTATTAAIGGATLAKTTGNGNCVTLSKSLVVGSNDTVYTTVVYCPGGKMISTTDTCQYLKVSGAVTFGSTLSVAAAITLQGGTTLAKKTSDGNAVQFSGSVAIGTSDTLFVPVLDATTLAYAPSMTVTTTLTVPGGGTITKTSTNGNSITINKSIVTPTTDTITSGVFSGTGNASFGGSLTVTGNLYESGRTIKLVSTPRAFDSTGTLSAAIMLRGVIKCNSASAVSMTTTTATLLAAAIPNCGQGTTFDMIIDNQGSSSGAITLVLDGSITVGSGVITGGNTLTVAISQIGKFTFYFNSTSAARCYRVF